MSRKYKFLDQTKLYFVSFATMHWIYIFSRELYKTILLDSLKFCQQNKGLEIFAWCIMTNHVHLIIGTTGMNMEDILRDFKSFTSRELKVAIKSNNQESRKEWMVWMMERAGRLNNQNNNWQLWQQHNKPIELFTFAVMKQKLDYIHNNPVEAGFVTNAADWIYSSAIDYAGGKGLLNVKLLDE
ncbi:MAG: transposase [Bacteroidota bacterium]